MVPTLFYELSMIDEMMTITEKYYSDVQHFFSFNFFFFSLKRKMGERCSPYAILGCKPIFQLLALQRRIWSGFCPQLFQSLIATEKPTASHCPYGIQTLVQIFFFPLIIFFFSFKTIVSQIINFLFQSFFKQIFIQFKKVTPVFTCCKRRKGRFYFSRCSFAMMVR